MSKTHWTATLTTCAIATAALITSILTATANSHLDATLKKTQQANTRMQRQLTENSATINNLRATIAGLSIPTDPLSAYNQICNNQFTNGVTGIVQTYYFPCTNTAQTIPQPGQ